MKLSSFCLWRWQFIRLGNRIANSGTTISCVEQHHQIEEQPSMNMRCSYCASSALRNLVLKFKSQWKHNLRWQNRSVQYSYDLHSYSLNFDDGFLH